MDTNPKMAQMLPSTDENYQIALIHKYIKGSGRKGGQHSQTECMQEEVKRSRKRPYF